MLPERPRFASERCPACGRDVDPIRAPRVLWLEDGVRFLCAEACRERFLAGERPYDAPARAPTPTASAPRPSIPDLVREATLVREPSDLADGEGASGRVYDPLVAMGLGLLALIIIAASPSRELGWLGAFLIVLCAAVNARIPLGTIRATPSLRLVGPAGLALAALAGVLASDPSVERWSLLGASAAAVVLSSRNWIHGAARTSVRALGRELRATLPRRARVPSTGNAEYEEVATSELRPGDQVVLLEAEYAPVDGIVEQGAGVGLLYPGATHSKRYYEGDFILAGTRLLEGAVTIRARRTKRDRSIVMAIDLSRGMQRDAGITAQIRYLLARWSWLPIGAGAAALLATSGIESAASLLLGLPALAALAALDSPLGAGARAAARRGMFFGSARALREASRTNTTAILLRGALTAGTPVVQQVKPVGTMRIEDVLGLAAAAEEASNEHPVARAIIRYAEEEGVAPATVRKERVLGGLGVTAVTTRGVSLVVGRRQLLLDEGISVAAADDDAKHIENEGLTPIFVAVDGNLEALISVLDPTHVGAPAAVQRIIDLPSEVVILSGDDRRTVERIASQLGASRVKAPLLPLERVQEVRALRETGGVTAAIGRGGEDDDVLAAADVPISLRLVGSAIEGRGIVVASRDVRDAASALWLARAFRRSTSRSFGACLAALAVVSLGAWLGWLTPAPAALFGLTMEAWSLRAGSRLLRRVDLRVPMRQ